MENKFISSMQNPLIKNILLLQNKKSERKNQGLFIIEGIKSVKDIPKSYEVKYYITSEAFNLEELFELDKNKHITVTQEIYKAISDTKTPQGVMAVIYQKPIKLQDLSYQEDSFGLILENMQDPGNLGTVIRSAYGFGIDYIILTKGSVDLYSPKTVRATMGALFHVPIVTEVEIEETLDFLKTQKVNLYVTAFEESIDLFKADFTKNVALIIGNEANGVTKFAKQKADMKIAIPMPGGLESLNASIAASICMYEGMKQRMNK